MHGMLNAAVCSRRCGVAAMTARTTACTGVPHYFAQLALLGGLAPDIVTAILEGRQPAILTRTRLARTKALLLDWNEQRRMLGFG